MILSCSHNDLDGVGAQVVLSQTFGNIIPLNTSYGKVQEQLEVMEDMLISRPGITEVFLTDLNITEPEMKIFRGFSDTYPHIAFSYIDHHDYDYEPTDYKSENLKIMVSKQYCATKLVYGFCKAHRGLEPSKDLAHFVDIVDAYDIWRLDSPLFKEGLRLNELFWSLFARSFFLRFKDVPKVRQADNEKIDKLFAKKDKVFKKLSESGRLFRAKNKSVLLCYVDEFRGHITLDFPDYWVYINVTLYGACSIRINGEKFTDDEAKTMKDSFVEYAQTLYGVTGAGGHINAMGVTTTLQGNNEGIIDLGRKLAIHADMMMEKTLKLYTGQEDIVR